MSDNLDMTPHLTLTPEADAAAAAAPAAPEAPALTLDPGAAAQEAAPVRGEPVLSEEERQKQRDANAVKLDESMLTEAERKMVDEFAQKIDVTDSSVVLQYGAAAQKNIASFSENALNSVRTKDLGEVGEALSSLVVELKGFGQEEDEGGIFGFFKKKRDKLEAMKASYAKAEVNVDKIVRALENHQVVLMKDIAMLDQMYELNTKYYKELTMYILAGKKRLEYLRTHDLAELKKKADNIVLHEEDNTIQLTAEGTPVGDRIKISTVTGAVVTDAGITTDGELILKFSDGTMKNLGVVVDEGGAVYVPHISDRKILSFTIEAEPQGVPDPVDLNPFDEWSGIGDDEVKTDYIWESL